ncbi:flavodoxin [Basfia succiniciproducens]|uniref:Flavodoxin n=1 Tax=Basfia succiniciproducens TaxID=653940 RepID=A0A1G5AEP0_9PAST|nr:flavodoxin [Basfia succiniciproducens]QIM68560.1 flavodoxin [Basfia succiniciproducens]SCX76344.1 Flavodoxin [Basfia succiniciproducens]
MKLLRQLSVAALGLFALQAAQSKNLIVYFTVPESVATEKLDGVSGASVIIKDNERLGSAEYLAKEVQKTAGGDLFRLETVQAYPTVHQQLLDFAQEEQRKNIRPALKAKPNLNGYETIFVAYPIWWYKLPMPLYSLFEQVDFSGKNIVPLVTHGGSRLSGTDRDIAQLQPKATVKDGFEYYLYKTTGADSTMEQKLADWLVRQGYAK